MPDELVHLVVGEAREPQAHDGVGAAQVGERVRERRRDVGLRVAERGEQEEARVPGRPGEVAEEHERRRVGPVAVLEHEQDRAPPDAAEQVRHRGVQAVALRVGIGLDRRRQLPDTGRQVGQQPGELPAGGAERVPQLGRLEHAREVVERLDERPVGRAHHRVAGAVEHERAAPGRLEGELAHEAALARAGLAAEEGDPPALVLPRRHERPERGQLGRAPDERERRRGAQRPREVVDGGPADGQI